MLQNAQTVGVVRARSLRQTGCGRHDVCCERALRVSGRSMKGGKAGQGRRRPAPRPDALEKLQQKQRQGPKRGERKKDWGASEREIPAVPIPAKRPPKSRDH